MKTKFIAASALAGLCLVTSHASATVVTATITGTVDSQFFSSAWGVNPFTSINNGDAYKAVYTFDTALAPVNDGSPTNTIAYGGSQSGLGTFGHVDVTVGGLAYSLDGTLVGNIQATEPSLAQNIWDGTSWYGPDYSLVAVTNVENGSFPIDFTTPGTYDLTGTNSIGQIDVETLSGGSWVTGGLLTIGLQSVTIANDTQTDDGSDNNSVPEPASLSLFAAGLVGASFFRRKKNGQDNLACA